MQILLDPDDWTSNLCTKFGDHVTTLEKEMCSDISTARFMHLGYVANGQLHRETLYKHT